MQSQLLDRPTQTAVTPERVTQSVFGFAPLYLLDAGARLGIFDALASRPKTADDVARECSVSIRGATALLNALTGLRFVTKLGESYSLTPDSAAFLVSDKPSYHGGLLRHAVESIVPHWSQLHEAIRTGKAAMPVSQESVGAGYFATFVSDLFAPNFPAAQALAKALPAAIKRKPFTVLDLAAGAAVWGIAIALDAPQAQVTAIDWKAVIPEARKSVSRFKLDDRFRFVEGDLIDADFGRNHAVAVLGQILHTNNPDWGRRVIRKTYEALMPGGTVAIAEWLVNEDRTEPVASLVFAVNMLVHDDGGNTYSFAEISEWLRECGFRNARTLDVPGPSPIILADK